jgi:arylsulfatase A-like enzyme
MFIQTALTSAAALAAVPSSMFAAEKQARPNVIFILADDLGYNDTGCYGADPKHIRTPNIDRMAAEGIKFMDAHSPSSVCTPSRYSLLTGDYAFRNQLGSRILPGDAPLSITPGTFTLPAMFKSQGYTTGIVGKWHLGLGKGEKDIDWNGEIKPGPCEIGFDEAFYIPATGDRVPTVYVRNHRIEGLDPADPITVDYKKPVPGGVAYEEHPEAADILKPIKKHDHNEAVTAGIGRIGYMAGGKSAIWKDEDISDVLIGEAERFIEKNREKAFFLYLATHGIHEPRVPHPRFRGKSGAGTYGDHTEELDDAIGIILTTVKKLGLDDNTLIVLSSDNGGCSWVGYDYKDGAGLNGHMVNGKLRGEKGSLWEGGTRIPLIVRWPGKVPTGKTSNALISQTDLLASFARLTGANLPANAALDSIDVLDDLLGKSETGRKELLEHRWGDANSTAFRSGNWKLLPGQKKTKDQLFDLSKDITESTDLAQAMPDRLNELKKRLNELKSAPRTR